MMEKMLDAFWPANPLSCRGRGATAIPVVAPAVAAGPEDPARHPGLGLSAGPATGEDTRRMPLDARIASLEDRHAALERRILDEDRRPMPDGQELARLKREKLRLKEEMERLRATTRH
jgi:hypothetical protein